MSRQKESRVVSTPDDVQYVCEESEEACSRLTKQEARDCEICSNILLAAYMLLDPSYDTPNVRAEMVFDLLRFDGISRWTRPQLERARKRWCALSRRLDQLVNSRAFRECRSDCDKATDEATHYHLESLSECRDHSAAVSQPLVH